MVNQVTRERLESLGLLYRQLCQAMPTGADELTRAEITEAVYQSNAIEYSSLTFQETESVLGGRTLMRELPVREIFEAVNLAKVMAELTESDLPPLTTQTVLHWHQTLLANIRDDAAGRYRQAGEWVRVGAHLGANPEFVSGLLQWYADADQMWFLDRIAKFHLEFEVIHPFVDGNGRIGRVLITQQLLQLGWPPLTIRAKGRTRDYYPLFDSYVITEKYDAGSKLLSVLLAESLHRRITALRARRTITLARWAHDHDLPGNSVTSKAKRQTIPAFRLRDRWMIDADFNGDTDQWLAEMRS